MNNRTRKKYLSEHAARVRKLPVQFVRDTLPAKAEAEAGKLTRYQFTGEGVRESRLRPVSKTYRTPVRPIPLDLASEAGRRLVLETAKRVIVTHADVLAALARR